jgi:UDP:flavonoid glycosyltransferase YjiC (YdhE family)
VEEFINDPLSKGFVYISFGTFVDSSKLPSAVVKIFLEAIESLPELRFVWKWNDVFKEKVPKNLMIVKWTAQLALLGTNNI